MACAGGDGMNTDINAQIAAVYREISMRQRVYPRWVTAGNLTQATADHEIAVMHEVLETLKRVRDEQSAKVNPSIFGAAS